MAVATSLWRRAKAVIPGGVNSPVRAMRSVGLEEPLFVRRGEGAWIEDEAGNRYYRAKGGKIDPALGIERRWVVYNGLAEASRVPPKWFGWLHHTVDVAPPQDQSQPWPWEKPHRPNPTGSPAAYRPSGSTLGLGRRPKATGDYKAWTPGGQ